MSRECKKALAKCLNAVGDSVENVSNVIDTFSKSYLANSKIEIAENLQESSIPGNNLQEKGNTAKETWENLIS